MKFKILLYITVLITPGYFYSLYSQSSFSLSAGDSSKFLLGAMNNSADPGYKHISNPKEFGMNLWHKYTSSEFDYALNMYCPTGWTPEDKLSADSLTYVPGIINILKENKKHKMKTLMHRPKIEWLCYGQRSDYQCEDEANVDSNYWFYTFQKHNTGIDFRDSSEFGNGQWVRYCRAGNPASNGTGSADFVVSRLIANNEQSFNLQSNMRRSSFFNHWDDSQYKWYIKPAIRIDKDFANDTLNNSTLVCRVDVYNADGYIESAPGKNKIKSIDIRIRNFKVSRDSLYRGNYLEEFYFSQNNDTSSQVVDGTQWSYYQDSLKTARGRVTDDAPWDMCKTDIRVYWYGNCDMWIDYVRVDNEIANSLFSTDTNNKTHLQYEQWIKWEAGLANYNNSPFKFYIEEFEFNNVPCIAYVNQKLKQYTNPGVDMMVCFYWRSFFSHLNMWGYQRTGYWTDAKKLDAKILHDVLIEKAGLTTFFTETYPFQTHDIGGMPYSKIPATLKNVSGDNILAITDSPSAYDDWLQVQLDNPLYPLMPDSAPNSDAGWQGWTFKLANDLALKYGTTFLNMPQTHLWRATGIEIRREPTNAELLLETNLAVSYGAKGLIYFWYGGFNNSTDADFGKGFLERTSPQFTPRKVNAYGEAKWDSLISIFKMLRKWSPYLMSFDNRSTNSFIYNVEHERNLFLDNTYFNSVRTYYRLTPNPEDTLRQDSDSVTYLQTAVFRSSEKNTYYFMIVNRRCSPYRPEINENGGRRLVKINFDNNAESFANNNKWKIVNVFDNSAVKTFYRNNTGTAIELGWFMPGEGRLYKIVPSGSD